MSFGNQYTIGWSDITEPSLKDEWMAPIDRGVIESPSEIQRAWIDDGVVFIPNLLPPKLIDNYVALWNRENKDRPGGWSKPYPYLWFNELKDISLYRPMMDVLRELLGDDPGLHLNLTGMVSTQRSLHADTYLNPEYVGTRYAAIWMALDDISEDSGPFQYVPGSHKWGVIKRDKVFNYLTKEEQADGRWPSMTQEWVSRACTEEIERRGEKLISHLPKKGGVLFWHSNLIHRGSQPTNPNARRPALIAHYSTLSSRLDMPKRAKHINGEHYFVFDDLIAQ